jgi:hypothetical protein
MSEQLLENLRGIHYPEPISWWPLAPGWYIILALILLVGLILGIWCYKRARKAYRRKYALAQIKRLKQQLAAHAVATSVLIAEVSVLLKRSALGVFPRAEVAGLQGQAWLQFLDKTGETQEFTQGVGRILGTAPYQPEPPIIPDKLFVLIEEWVKKVL